MLSERRISELKNLQEQLMMLNNSIQDVVEGKSTMRKLADTLNITAQNLNTGLNENTLSLLKKAKIMTADQVNQLLIDSMSPYERLMKAILGCSYNEMYVLDIAEEEAFDKLIKEVLTEKEEAVIKIRFGFVGGIHSLQDTANIFDLCIERIRQIEAKAIRKLKSAKNLKKLLPNYELRIASIQETYEMNKLEEQLKAEEKNAVELDDPIESLKFSIRTYNCLKRHHINYVRELVSIADFNEVKMLGPAGIQEVLDKLVLHGFIDKQN